MSNALNNMTPEQMVNIAGIVVRLRENTRSLASYRRELVRVTGTGHTLALAGLERDVRKAAQMIDLYTADLSDFGLSDDFIAGLTADIDTTVPDSIVCTCEWCAA